MFFRSSFQEGVNCGSYLSEIVYTLMELLNGFISICGKLDEANKKFRVLLCNANVGQPIYAMKLLPA